MVKRPIFLLSALFLVTMVAVALLAPWLAPYSPYDLHEGAYSQRPFVPGFTLGTDDVGRDVLSRLIHGARFSLGIGFLSVLLSFLVGTPLGLWSGYYGGRLDQFIMRATDMLMALPGMLLAIVFISVFGPGLTNTIWAVSVVALPGIIRVVRASTLAEKEKLYINAAVGFGNSSSKIILRHILPNIAPALIVQASLGFSDAILNAAALGFLGLGAQPPTPEWGVMLADARPYMESAWWLVTFPGLCILSASLGFNLLGDSLRDMLDPRLR